MKYKINSLMKKNLKSRDILSFANKNPLELKLQKIIDKGVVKKDGLLLLNTERFLQNLGRSPDYDSTGKEMWVNKFHVEDFIEKKKRKREHVLQQGVAFALALKDILKKKKYKGISYKIIVSTDEGEDTYPEVCTVGFHTIRKNEILLKDDLDSYKMNGLLVITV